MKIVIIRVAVILYPLCPEIFPCQEGCSLSMQKCKLVKREIQPDCSGNSAHLHMSREIVPCPRKLMLLLYLTLLSPVEKFFATSILWWNPLKSAGGYIASIIVYLIIQSISFFFLYIHSRARFFNSFLNLNNFNFSLLLFYKIVINIKVFIDKYDNK